jgi:ankyrin repeat protein
MGVSVDYKDYKSRIPLHYACKTGSMDLADFLVDCGSDINAKDIDNLTPVELGLKKGYKNVLSIIN